MTQESNPLEDAVVALLMGVSVEKGSTSVHSALIRAYPQHEFILDVFVTEKESSDGGPTS